MCIIYTFLYPAPLHSASTTGKYWGHFPNSGNPESPIRCVAPPPHPPKIPKFQHPHFIPFLPPFSTLHLPPHPHPPRFYPTSFPLPSITPFPPKPHHYTLLYPIYTHPSPLPTTNPHKKHRFVFRPLC